MTPNDGVAVTAAMTGARLVGAAGGVGCDGVVGVEPPPPPPHAERTQMNAKTKARRTEHLLVKEK
jgi:hypothetical protein